MKKRTDVQIFEFAHIKTPYPLDDNSLYTPIQTGAELSKVDVCELKDNTLDNISSANWFFCEETGTYWVWKNMITTQKYIGQCQYRRRLYFTEDCDFDSIFNMYDIILPRPYQYGMTVEEHYKRCHIVDDIELVEKIIKEKYPEYASAYDGIIKNGHTLFYSASYVMKVEDYRKWCEFFFGVMNEYKKVRDYDDYNGTRKYIRSKIKSKDKITYQQRIGGYLQERLFTLYVLRNFPSYRICIMDYRYMEDEEGMKKVTYLK